MLPYNCDWDKYKRNKAQFKGEGGENNTDIDWAHDKNGRYQEKWRSQLLMGVDQKGGLKR